MEIQEEKAEMLQIDPETQFSFLLDDDTKRKSLLERHKLWLSGVVRERPNANLPYKVGVYIRFFNQTKYDDYLKLHVKQFADAISLCPKWQIIDYYIDEGPSAPFMESAPEWSRLLQDGMDGKVDLILTQKISNVSKSIDEVTFCSRMLAALPHPVGIYFISEDIFTLASYYQDDLHDLEFLPSSQTVLQTLPEEKHD